jgi:hypothetical protein
MDSTSCCDNCPLKRAFIDSDEQIEALQKLKQHLITLRVKGKKKLLPFKQGWLISLQSTIQLFDHLQSAYKASYVFTHRLSQDVLESTFPQIRYIVISTIVQRQRNLIIE